MLIPSDKTIVEKVSKCKSLLATTPFKASMLFSSLPPEPPLLCRECGSDKPGCRNFCEKSINGYRQNFSGDIIPYENINLLVRKNLTQLAFLVVRQNSLERKDLALREWARADIQDLMNSEEVKESLKKRGCTITKPFIANLFGSSANGLGSPSSDLDVCITVEGINTLREAGFVSQKGELEIFDIALHANNHRFYQDIEAVADAKVPIMRFVHKGTGLEGDLSIYNALPLRNTKLIKAYVDFDPVVKELGVVIKKFCKTAEIGDASKGGLSSYAYILMLIHYLQKMKVLPNLQENPEQKQVLYEGITKDVMWNTFFIEDENKIKELQSSYNSHSHDFCKLFLGFLHFYAFEFDWQNHVVSINRLDTLTAYEKKWTSKTLKIEDPFDLGHNLGTGPSKQMGLYIVKCFSNGYEHFSRLKGAYQDVVGTFLDRGQIQRGQAPPQDRNCRHCGIVGHFKDQCPKLNRNLRKKHSS